MYDVIIVGARCAGAPTAMLLARKGYRVLMVDKATFPSDIMSGHYIHLKGVAKLKRWGLLDQVVRSNCPPIHNFLLDFGSVTLSGTALPFDGITEAYAPRRTKIDKILVDAAVEAGAQLYEGFQVQEILKEGERVVGIRGRSADGTLITEKAALVVGADGRNSLVARQVGAPAYQTKPALACYYYTYWSGVPGNAELYVQDRHMVFVLPTNDNLTGIAIGASIDHFPAIRRNVKDYYTKTIEAIAPGLAERMRDGKPEERFIGTKDLPNFFRKPYGPGWALVGDAGYHKDPVLGQGMSDAFRGAELVAEAIDAGLSARQPLQEALSQYERQRNEDVMPMYKLNSEFATMEPPSEEMWRLLKALQTNQMETDRFFAVIGGAISPDEFFAREHVDSVIEAAGLTSPVGRM